MTDANYIRHLKVLGKLCKLYDVAAADVATLQTLQSTTYDQVATGASASLPGVKILAGYYSRYENAINSGPTALQTLAVAAATSYMTGDDFVNDLTTVPTSRSGLAVATAFGTETTLDAKTLTTEASTGLVNFFEAVADDELAFNTAVDGSADYRDSVYVVSAVV